MLDNTDRATNRLRPIDAARGIAMLGVCLSHFGIGIQHAWPDVASKLWLIGMYASPTFVGLSGTVFGFLVSSNTRGAGAARRKLLDRGLFLLLVAHFLILGAHLLRMPPPRDWFHFEFMTDTIGVSLIVATLFLPSVRLWRRAAMACALYAGAWAVVVLWSPSGDSARLIKDALFGSLNGTEIMAQTFPFIMWGALFLLGTILGELLARARQVEARIALFRRVLWLGGASIAIGFALKLGYYALRPAGAATAWRSVADIPPGWSLIYELTTPFDKYPPGPGYLLVYGGIGAVLVAGCFLAEDNPLLRPLFRFIAVMGRASLVVFVVQFYLFYLLVPALPLSNPLVLPLYWLALTMVLWCVAWGWLRWAGNHLITVGLSRRYPQLFSEKIGTLD